MNPSDCGNFTHKCLTCGKRWKEKTQLGKTTYEELK